MLYVNPLTSNGLEKSGGLMDTPARRQVALKELEQFFVYTLFQEMRKTVPDGGLFPKGQTEEFADHLFDDMMSKRIAETGQFGIASMVEQQLRLNETRDVKTLLQPMFGTPSITPPAGPDLRFHLTPKTE